MESIAKINGSLVGLAGLMSSFAQASRQARLIPSCAKVGVLIASVGV